MPALWSRLLAVCLALVATLATLGAPWLVHGHVPVFRWQQERLPWLTSLGKVLPAFYEVSVVAMVAQVMLLLLLAAGCLALVRWMHARSQAQPPEQPMPENMATSRPWSGPGQAKLWWVSLGVSTALWLVGLGYFLDLLSEEQTPPHILRVWLALQALALIPALLLDWRFQRLPRGLLNRWEALFLAGLMGVVLLLNAWDLNHWRYSCIGDEWAFYLVATAMAESEAVSPQHVFGDVTAGVQMQHTPLQSLLQSFSLRLLGTHNFAWRLADVLFFVFTLPPLYLAARSLLGRPGAVFAVLATAFSHYLMALAHAGYGQTIWAPAAMAVLALMYLTVQTRSLTLAVLLGLACVYASLIAAAAMPAPVLALLGLIILLLPRPAWGLPRRLLGLPRRLLGRPGLVWGAALFLVVLGLYLSLAVVPQAAFKNPDSPFAGLRGMWWKTNVGPLISHYYGADWHPMPVHKTYDVYGFLENLRDMTLRAFLAPLTYRLHKHYVVGHVADPFLAGLSLLGLLLAVGMAFRRRIWAVFLLAYLCWVLLVCALSPYHDLPSTRVQFMVPLWSVLAGLGLCGLLRAWQRALGGMRPWVCWGVVGLLALSMAAWNLREFHVRMPNEFGVMPQCLAMRELQTTPPDVTIYACLPNWHPLDLLYKAYPGQERMQFLDMDTLLFQLPWQTFKEGDRFLFMDGLFDANHRPLFERLVGQYPGMERERVYNARNHHYMERAVMPVTAQPPGPTRAGQVDAPAASARVPLSSLRFIRMPFWELSNWGKTPRGAPIRVAGEPRNDAMALPPRGVIHVPLPAGHAWFETALAVDDEPAPEREASVSFEILLDGHLAMPMREVRRGEAPYAIRLPLGEAELLSLRTFPGPNSPPNEAFGVCVAPVLVRAATP